MKRLLDYLVLPPNVSDFERQYLARMNRVGLGFFLLHLPLLVGIAWANDTNPLLAAALTCAVLSLPLAAGRVFSNPRVPSLVFGFTAMLMGGLLVHFGQGPVQIEMHFYFFVLLALLAVFANPMAIVTAAVTAAVHHLVLWLLLPASVFNYAAPLWVVAVHATFVVLESVAACFIARSFFDNVIGLEKIVAARTSELDGRNRDMRLVLDNVEQGFLTLDLSGRIGSEYSKVLETWLGVPEAGQTFASYLGKEDENVGATFRMGWDDLIEGFMLAELVIEQFPSRLRVGERDLRIRYSPIEVDGKLARMLVIITDATAEIAAQRLESAQRETVGVFQRIMKDKSGFLDFYEEATSIVQKLASGNVGGTREEMRALHTVKGNCGLYGIQSVAELCHHLESQIVDEDRVMTPEERTSLETAWGHVGANLQGLLGDRVKRAIEVDDAEYERLLSAVLRGAPKTEVATILRGWRYEPAAVRLGRMADQARDLARRLGKDAIEVVVEGQAVRLAPDSLSQLWASMAHIVRNAIDHGIEPAEERREKGKPGAGALRLRTELADDTLDIVVIDDGRGIVWSDVRERAKSKGLPAATHEDLVEALFCDGLSTRDSVSDISGRGVGLGAVRQAVRDLGGSVFVSSASGGGTEFRIRVPLGTQERVLAIAA